MRSSPTQLEHEPGLWEALTVPVGYWTHAGQAHVNSIPHGSWPRRPKRAAEAHVALEVWWVQEHEGSILIRKTRVAVMHRYEWPPQNYGDTLEGVVLAALQTK